MFTIIEVTAKRGRSVQSYVTFMITDAAFECTSSLTYVKYMSGVSTFEATNNINQVGHLARERPSDSVSATWT